MAPALGIAFLTFCLWQGWAVIRWLRGINEPPIKPEDHARFLRSWPELALPEAVQVRVLYRYLDVPLDVVGYNCPGKDLKALLKHATPTYWKVARQTRTYAELEAVPVERKRQGQHFSAVQVWWEPPKGRFTLALHQSESGLRNSDLQERIQRARAAYADSHSEPEGR